MDPVSLPMDAIHAGAVRIVNVQIDDQDIKSEVADIGCNVDDNVGVKVLWSDSSNLREFHVITEDDPGKPLSIHDEKPLSLHDPDIGQAEIIADNQDDDIAGNTMHIVVAEHIADSTIIGHHGNRLLVGDDSLSGDGISTRAAHLSSEHGILVEEAQMLHVPDPTSGILGDAPASIQVATSLASALTAQADQDVIQLLLPSTGDHSVAGQAISINLGGSTSGDSMMAMSPPVQTLQSITFSDGTTAFIQHPTKFLEGQTITLDDGTTAVVQGLPGKLNIETTAIATSMGTEEHKMTMADSHTVQLEDGTTGYLNQAVKDGLQAIVLEDGTTAYLATQQTPQFMENATLEATTFTLDQLTGQMPGIQALIPNTMVNMDVKPQLTSTQAVVSTMIEQQNKTIQIAGNNTDAVYVAPAPDKSLAFGEKAYKCGFDGCGRLYTTMHHLKVHERSHTGDRPFRCEFPNCEKAFATGYGLKSHTRVHTGEKPYKCPEDLCEKGFKTSGDLQKHVRTHTGERPFKCPFEGCTRCFTTSNIRKVHIRTHTGERPYVCPEENCARAFASATNYKNHVRIHTGEKPYICTVQGCGKRFTEYSSLYKHHVVHTHTKPYTCSRCGKTYRQTSTLAMHKRTAHGEDATAESEAAFFEGQEGYEPPEKRTRLNFTLMPETSTEDGEGTLIINTSEPNQQLTLVDSDNLTSVIAGATDGLGVLPGNNQSSLLRQSGVATFTLSEQAQQVYVITNPVHLEALQQIAQQHIDSDANKETVTAPPSEVMHMKMEAGVTTFDEVAGGDNNIVINNGAITVNGCSDVIRTDYSEPSSVHMTQYGGGT